MYIVPLAWLYVVLMMAVVEATSVNGTLPGAITTFVFYGLIPVAVVVYILGSPARRRASRAREASEMLNLASGEVSTQPDAGRHATADGVAPVREEP